MLGLETNIVRNFGDPYAGLSTWGHWGDASSGSSSSAQQAGQLLAAYQSASDVRQQIAVINARIANYQAMKQQVPLLSFYYDNQINIDQAKLTALQQQLTLQVQSEQATTDWRSLGQTGGAVGVVAGVALIALLAVITVKVATSR